MRRVLLVLGLMLFLSSPAAAQNTVAMTFSTIANAGPNFANVDISPSGDRVLYVKCDAHKWWSFLPTGLKRFLTTAVGCSSRALVVVSVGGESIASMPYPDKRYWDPHFVGEDRIVLYDHRDDRIRLFSISPGVALRPIEDQTRGLSHRGSNPKVSAGLFRGKLSIAFEGPVGRIAIETVDGKDLHLLDGFHIVHANDVGLAGNVVWFRVAIKKKMLDAYRGPAKIIARYPFPGGGGPGVEEASGFAVFGPNSGAIDTEILNFLRRFNPTLPYVQDRGRLRYQIVDVSPNGDFLIALDRSRFFLLEQRYGEIRPVEVSVPGGPFPRAVVDDGRMVAIERTSTGDRLIKFGTPIE